MDNISPSNKRILLAFSSPCTPKKARHQLCLKKITFKEYLKNKLLKCLTPDERNTKLYVLTDKARMLLGEPPSAIDLNKDWKCIGWLLASPRQRLVVLRSVDDRKLCSEEVRMVATMLNCRISRPSMKDILKELVGRRLVDTEIMEHVRFYWITDYGKKIKDEMAVIAPLSPAISS